MHPPLRGMSSVQHHWTSGSSLLAHSRGRGHPLPGRAPGRPFFGGRGAPRLSWDIPSAPLSHFRAGCAPRRHPRISRPQPWIEFLSLPSPPFLFVLYSGMDFYVVLYRPGFRVARRRKQKSAVGTQHKIKKEDAIKWFQTKYEGVVLNKSQSRDQ